MSENNYTWHELNDCKTIQMVPSPISHPVFKHLGRDEEIAKELQDGNKSDD